jgi:transcriptional repressor NrdR
MEDKVIESRQNVDGTAVRRRRECMECAYRFTSYERIEDRPLLVVKRDGRREPFDVSKLERGIQRAVEKRPVSHQQIVDLLDQVEDAALMAGIQTREVPTKLLGDLVLGKLYELDRVAYVRFASVYKMFENVNEFVREIESFSQSKNSGGEL